MRSEKVIAFALAALLAFCAILILRKLFEMLFAKAPYDLRREVCIDKVKQPCAHALYVFVLMLGLVVSFGISWLCIWTALHI